MRYEAERQGCRSDSCPEQACAYQKGLIRPVYKSRWPFQREQLRQLWPSQRNRPSPVVAYSLSAHVPLSVTNFDRCGLFIVDNCLFPVDILRT
jgi:hypothetical protein